MPPMPLPSPFCLTCKERLREPQFFNMMIDYLKNKTLDLPSGHRATCLTNVRYAPTPPPCDPILGNSICQP